ncbi:hypothetical protein N665_0066s0073 [Sinapis alba]|nr:hypothetical protein N665_0066s0073 [Sinapis alba]
MDEEGEHVISIGARPKSSKEPNPLNQARRERDAQERGGRQRGRGQRGRGQRGRGEGRGEAHEQEEERQVEEAHHQEAQEEPQPQEPQSKIPPFNDGSEITIDWTTSDLFDDPIYQHADTCASVVFTRLTQAAYNKDKPMAQRRNLSYQHLANHIKSKTGKKKSFSFRNFSIAKDFIRDDGIHRDEIYNVPGKRDDQCEEHALLAVAKGRTQDGIDFIVVQNSWGTKYGNNGYFRIFLPDGRDYDIFWPEW